MESGSTVAALWILNRTMALMAELRACQPFLKDFQCSLSAAYSLVDSESKSESRNP